MAEKERSDEKDNGKDSDKNMVIFDDASIHAFTLYVKLWNQ